MGLPEPHSYGQGTSGDDFMRPFYWAEEVEDIVTELAALKGQRCENCKSWEADRVGPENGTCHQGVLDGLVDTTTNSFGCNQWTARAEEGTP